VFALNTFTEGHNKLVSTVFFDIDTQLDFMCPAGALYVPGAEKIVGQLSSLTRYAAGVGIKVLSSIDAHAEDDMEFKHWPPHCVVDTQGQQKIAATQLPKPLVLTTERGALDGITEFIPSAKQIVIEKQAIDVFSNPNLRSLLSLLKPAKFVVYGVATEVCVECAALGLLRLGHKVELVTDAIKGLNREQEEQMLKRFGEAGGTVTTCSNVVAASASA
jgi:nicotinamidase/pyrazinamidase